jgi:hypothetical protein
VNINTEIIPFALLTIIIITVKKSGVAGIYHVCICFVCVCVRVRVSERDRVAVVISSLIESKLKRAASSE